VPVMLVGLVSIAIQNYVITDAMSMDNAKMALACASLVGMENIVR